MGKQHIILIVGTLYLLLSAYNELPKMKHDLIGYLWDMFLIVLVTLCLLLFLYILQK